MKKGGSFLSFSCLDADKVDALLINTSEITHIQYKPKEKRSEYIVFFTDGRERRIPPDWYELLKKN